MPNDPYSTDSNPAAITAELGTVPVFARQAINRRPMIGKAILERFADGAWHPIDEIVAAIPDADRDHVETTLAGISKNHTYGCRAEKRRSGNVPQWRIFQEDSAIPVAELRAKLGPIVKALTIQGR